MAAPVIKQAPERIFGRSDLEFPHLELIRPDLENLPPIDMAEGFSLRNFQTGDDDKWAEIMTEAFGPFWNKTGFRRLVKRHFSFAPERIFFACDHGVPVGSAGAFQWPGVSHEIGYIHMVGIKKAYAGKGLGRNLTLACLNYFRNTGCRQAMLQTESYRLPAIKIYLRLGFLPVLANNDQIKIWKEVLRKIGDSGLGAGLVPEQFPKIPLLKFFWREIKVSSYVNWLYLKGSVQDLPLLFSGDK
jgi:mycothiol synthase